MSGRQARRVAENRNVPLQVTACGRCAKEEHIVKVIVSLSARQVLQIAQEEAAANHNYVGTEHLLLGLAGRERIGR